MNYGDMFDSALQSAKNAVAGYIKEVEIRKEETFTIDEAFQQDLVVKLTITTNELALYCNILELSRGKSHRLAAAEVELATMLSSAVDGILLSCNVMKTARIMECGRPSSDVSLYGVPSRQNDDSHKYMPFASTNMYCGGPSFGGAAKGSDLSFTPAGN